MIEEKNNQNSKITSLKEKSKKLDQAIKILQKQLKNEEKYGKK